MKYHYQASHLPSYIAWRCQQLCSSPPQYKQWAYRKLQGGFFFCAMLQFCWLHHPAVHLERVQNRETASFKDSMFKHSSIKLVWVSSENQVSVLMAMHFTGHWYVSYPDRDKYLSPLNQTFTAIILHVPNTENPLISYWHLKATPTPVHMHTS